MGRNAALHIADRYLTGNLNSRFLRLQKLFVQKCGYHGFPGEQQLIKPVLVANFLTILPLCLHQLAVCVVKVMLAVDRIDMIIKLMLLCPHIIDQIPHRFPIPLIGLELLFCFFCLAPVFYQAHDHRKNKQSAKKHKRSCQEFPNSFAIFFR